MDVMRYTGSAHPAGLGAIGASVQERQAPTATIQHTQTIRCLRREKPGRRTMHDSVLGCHAVVQAHRKVRAHAVC